MKLCAPTCPYASACCTWTTWKSELDDPRSAGTKKGEWWVETNVGCEWCMCGWTWCPCPIPCPCCGFCTCEHSTGYERCGIFGCPLICFQSKGVKQKGSSDVLWSNRWGGVFGIAGAWKGKALYKKVGGHVLYVQPDDQEEEGDKPKAATTKPATMERDDNQVLES